MRTLRFSAILAALVFCFVALRSLDGIDESDITASIILVTMAVIARFSSGAKDVEGLIGWANENRTTAIYWTLLSFVVVGAAFWGLSVGRVTGIFAITSVIQTLVVFSAFLFVGAWLKKSLRHVWARFWSDK
jgi:hypothetical protein